MAEMASRLMEGNAALDTFSDMGSLRQGLEVPPQYAQYDEGERVGAAVGQAVHVGQSGKAGQAGQLCHSRGLRALGQGQRGNSPGTRLGQRPRPPACLQWALALTPRFPPPFLPSFPPRQ